MRPAAVNGPPDVDVPAGGTAMVERLAAPRAEPRRDGEAPDDEVLARILEVATTVPDHGGLRPWRFVVVRGSGRDRFGQALVDGLHEQRGSGLPDAVVAKMRQKAYAAPCCVVLVASPDPEANVPVWEQEASAACTGYAVVLAAHALGFGAVWKSAATVDAPAVRRFFGLVDRERLLGWVNLGTPRTPSSRSRAETSRPALGEVVTVVGDDGPRPLVTPIAESAAAPPEADGPSR
ncbi:MAG TPA: nitroreductase [Acidimicrobiales bacterium]|nr:nitroreductase [Acidimicrobiales bacterium]